MRNARSRRRRGMHAARLTWYAVIVMNTVQTDPSSELRAAAAANDSAPVGELLSRGADIEARDAQGRSPLLLATRENAVDAARVLIGAGADVNAKDDIGDSPYLYAGAEGRLQILRMTLKAGADLASVNRYGGTALIPAAHHGHVATVHELLKTAIDVDHVNDLGWTALLEAIILGNGGSAHIEIVQLLIDAGADVDLADGDGVPPLAHARTRGYAEIADRLRAAGASANRAKAAPATTP
jgi:ankyrin repeat protein